MENERKSIERKENPFMNSLQMQILFVDHFTWNVIGIFGNCGLPMTA